MDRIAIVGAGRWGSTVAKKISSAGIARIVAVYDIDQERAVRLSSEVGAEALGSLEDLSKIPGLSGVVVATSIASLAETAMRIVDMGLNVLVEKPVADRLEKVRMLKTLARKRGVLAMPGFIARFDPVTAELKKRLGRADSVENLYLFRMSRRPEWARSSSIVLDLAVHDIDLARYLLEQDLSPISWHTHSLGEDEAFTMYARYKGGLVAVHVDGAAVKKVRRVLALGGRGSVEADYVESEILVRRDSVEKLRVGGEEALVREVRTFLAICRGGEDPEAPTLEDAEKVHEILEIVRSPGSWAGSGGPPG